MNEAAFLYCFALNDSTSLTCMSIFFLAPLKEGFSYSIQPQTNQISMNEECSNEPFYIMGKYLFVWQPVIKVKFQR
jgi:hypothetical protein